MSRILSPILNYDKLHLRFLCWLIYHRFLHLLLAIFSLALAYIALGILADQQEFALIKKFDISIVRMIDVGQGDGFEIVLPTGNVLFVDIGQFYQKFMDSISRRTWSQDSWASHFGKKNFLRSDLVFLTHDDADHAGALIGVAKEVSIGALVLSPYQYSYIEALNRNSKSARSSKNIIPQIKTIFSQQFIFQNGFTIKMLSPQMPKTTAETERRSVNDDSLVFKMNLGSTSIMFTGDASEKVEKNILQHFGKESHDDHGGLVANELKSDILKVGHHGSKTSTSDSFLKVVDPYLALISAGKNNRYKHPAKPILKKLDKNGIAILRTDQCGQVDLYIFPGGAIGRRACIF